MAFKIGFLKIKGLVETVEKLRPGTALVHYCGFTIGKSFFGVAWLGAPAACPHCAGPLVNLINLEGQVVKQMCPTCNVRWDAGEIL